MKKMAAGVLPVIALLALQEFFGFAPVQLWITLATLPVVVLFIVAYLPEHPTRQWFGTSLLLLAFGVLSVCIAAVSYRIFGLDYPGRPVLVTIWVGLMFVSMVMRTWVLLGAQWRDGAHVGGWLRRALHRP